MKRITLALLITVFSFTFLNAQQWSGDNNATGTIGRTGNVGIGTTSPSEKLDVIGKIKGDKLQIGNTSQTNGLYATYEINDIRFYRSNGPSYIRQQGNKELIFSTGEGNTQAVALTLFPNQNARFFNNVLINGNVGVGTSTPQSRMEVVSSGAVYTSNYTLAVKDLSNRGTLSLESVTDKPTDFIFKNNNRITWSMTTRASDEEYDLNFSPRTFDGSGWAPTVLTLQINGNVGIGTKAPISKLQVAGNILSNDPTKTNNWNNNWLSGIYESLDALNGPEELGWFWGINMGHSSNSADYRYNGQIVIKNSSTSPTMYFRSTTKTGDGTWAKVLHDQGDQSIDGGLCVNGTINATKIEITETVPCSDYVFEPNYNLLSLEEVAKFVKENRHLPEVPSAAEFKENGYSVGEMDDILLRKVEELTLYAIEQQKELEEKDEEIENLKSRFIKDVKNLSNLILDQQKLIEQLQTEVEQIKTKE